MLDSQSIACPSCGEPVLLLAWNPPDEPPQHRTPPPPRRRSRRNTTQTSSSSPKRGKNEYMRFIGQRLREGASMAQAQAAWRRRNGSETAEPRKEASDEHEGPERKGPEDDEVDGPDDHALTAETSRVVGQQDEYRKFMRWAMDEVGLTVEEAGRKWRERGDTT